MCDDDNVVFVCIIESCGGVFEDVCVVDGGCMLCCYWVDFLV